MRRVVDASVAVKWHLDEDGAEAALALLESGRELIAPELIVAECANAFMQAAREGRVDAAHAEWACGETRKQFSRLFPLADLARPAAEAMTVIGHRAIYDCFYLALAARESSPLITADDGILKAVRGTRWEKFAVHLSDAESRGALVVEV